jgi:6-pyruvoyl-tetrahydropterin synthase
MELQRIYKAAFEAGHFIKDHPKCGVQHGHSYHLTVCLDGNSQVWYDFADIKTAIDNLLNSRFDHKFLGDKTAESIAEDIVNELQLEHYHGSLELFETDKFGVKLNF